MCEHTAPHVFDRFLEITELSGFNIRIKKEYRTLIYARHRLAAFRTHSSATKEFNFDKLKVELFQSINGVPRDKEVNDSRLSLPLF